MVKRSEQLDLKKIMPMRDCAKASMMWPNLDASVGSWGRARLHLVDYFWIWPVVEPTWTLGASVLISAQGVPGEM